MPRKILHLDLDAFFCAVEELHNPALRGKPFAVGGRPESRGVVASCSYAARQFGVHSAMPMARALRLCPGLLVVSTRHGVYGDYSRQVMDRLYQLTALVEPISIDEAFLDLSDLPEPGLEIARRLQSRIQQELGLPCSLGVATNKLVAKIATDTGKAARRGPTPPNAITVVPPGEEAAFLAPLPVSALWGVGPKSAARLEGMGIHTIGDLAQMSPAALVSHFGKNGADLARHARGIDDAPVVTTHEVKSISQETTFERDLRESEALRRTLLDLSEGSRSPLASGWPVRHHRSPQAALVRFHHPEPPDHAAPIHRPGRRDLCYHLPAVRAGLGRKAPGEAAGCGCQRVGAGISPAQPVGLQPGKRTPAARSRG